MKIIMSVPMEGPNVHRRAGDEVDTDDEFDPMTEAEAERLLSRGMAKRVKAAADATPKGERATAAKGETR